MSAAQQPVSLAPFDAVALEYDDTFTSSRIGRAQRSAVWCVLEKAFRPGERILEIGCGTGVDACFLAERGVQVLACDSSSQMVDVASRRVHAQGLQNVVQSCVLPAEELSGLPAEDAFDGAFSNFGALNCIGDLRQFARDLSVRLKPGGTVLFCWMGRFCLWEALWYLAHGNPRKAFRRLNRDRVSARVADGVFVQVQYPSVKQIVRCFAPEFRVKSVRGIGLAVPPSYVENWAQSHPAVFDLCQKTDSILGGVPGVRLLADHVLVTLQREGLNEVKKTGARKP